MDTTDNWKRNTGPATTTFTECRVAYRAAHYVAFFAVYTDGTAVFCYSDRLAGPRAVDEYLRLAAAAARARMLNGVRL